MLGVSVISDRKSVFQNSFASKLNKTWGRGKVKRERGRKEEGERKGRACEIVGGQEAVRDRVKEIVCHFGGKRRRWVDAWREEGGRGEQAEIVLIVSLTHICLAHASVHVLACLCISVFMYVCFKRAIMLVALRKGSTHLTHPPYLYRPPHRTCTPTPPIAVERCEFILLLVENVSPLFSSQLI